MPCPGAGDGDGGFYVGGAREGVFFFQDDGGEGGGLKVRGDGEELGAGGEGEGASHDGQQPECGELADYQPEDADDGGKNGEDVPEAECPAAAADGGGAAPGEEVKPDAEGGFAEVCGGCSFGVGGGQGEPVFSGDGGACPCAFAGSDGGIPVAGGVEHEPGELVSGFAEPGIPAGAQHAVCIELA